MDPRRIIGALDELDYPSIHTIDLGELVTAILQQKNARQIYSIPYLIMRILRDINEPIPYLRRTIMSISSQKIKTSFIELLSITFEIYSHSKDKCDERTKQILENVLHEFASLKICEKISDAYKKQENYTLNTGVIVNLSSAERNLYNYEIRRNMRAHAPEERPLREEFRIQYLLSQLFAPRQKEILLKRYSGIQLTRAEIEYYSRVIKKRIDAILNPDIKIILEKTRLH